jgi:hypothetical protein
VNQVPRSEMGDGQGVAVIQLRANFPWRSLSSVVQYLALMITLTERPPA